MASAATAFRISFITESTVCLRCFDSSSVLYKLAKGNPSYAKDCGETGDALLTASVGYSEFVPGELNFGVVEGSTGL
jgi:hypothetical protein